MVTFTIIEIEETIIENIVNWLKIDLDDRWYKYLWTTKLMQMVRYIRLATNMLTSNDYKLTIIIMMCSIFTFKM